MSQRFKGVINVDIRDSVPDWAPFEAPKAPEVLTDTLDGDEDAIQDGDRGDERPNDQRIGSW